jgi:hypothetical protein
MNESKYPFEIKLSESLPLYKTSHFNIYYYPESFAEKEIDIVAKQREKAYDEISAFLNTNEKINIDLYLFNDAITKESETNHRGTGWAFDTVMVEIYNETTKCHPYHELVHVFTDKIFGETVSFFSEGLAVYISESFSNQDFGDYVNYNTHEKVLNFYKSNELFTLKEMFSFEIGSSISKPQISYPQAACLIKYFYNLLGSERFYNLYRILKADYSDEWVKNNVSAVEKCFEKSSDQLFNEWINTIV